MGLVAKNFELKAQLDLGVQIDGRQDEIWRLCTGLIILFLGLSNDPYFGTLDLNSANSELFHFNIRCWYTSNYCE